MSRECWIVNGGDGGAFVNPSEQVIDDQNKMVIDEPKIDLVFDSDQTVASINHRVYPPSSNKLKAPSSLNHKLKRDSGNSEVLQNEKILQLKNEVDYVSGNLNITQSDLKVKIIII